MSNTEQDIASTSHCQELWILTTGYCWANLHGLPMPLEQEVEAVVSLCRVGRADVADGVEHVLVWLIDQDDANANLDS